MNTKNKEIVNVIITCIENEILNENKYGKILLEVAISKSDVQNCPYLMATEYVVPQFCKRQLLIYLKTINNGGNHDNAIYEVLMSRYDNNQSNPNQLCASDFVYLHKIKKLNLVKLLREMINKEENLDRNREKQIYVFSLIDVYFKNIYIGELSKQYPTLWNNISGK